MSEPETITLRKLPPEHVLRKGVDYVLDKGGWFMLVGGLAVTRACNPDYAACYCRAEDYPAEYDKPGIDPGEGWRIYDQHKEGREPKKVIEFLDGDGKWKPRPFPCEELTKTAVYRVPITPQPDRLTELRQQGERQAKRIVELEASEKELQEKLQILKHNHSEQGKALTEQGEYIESLQTQVRSAEEALRVEKQKHDEAVKQLEQQGMPIGNNPSQARAWREVAATLSRRNPEWSADDGRTLLMEKAIAEIERLYRISKPLRWERRKPTEEECRERWIGHKTAECMLYMPDSTMVSNWDDDDVICVFPPNSFPEPERRMVTQRRWLVKSRHGWEEIWIFPEDNQPCSTWMETIRTDRTREVPE